MDLRSARKGMGLRGEDDDDDGVGFAGLCLMMRFMPSNVC